MKENKELLKEFEHSEEKHAPKKHHKHKGESKIEDTKKDEKKDVKEPHEPISKVQKHQKSNKKGDGEDEGPKVGGWHSLNGGGVGDESKTDRGGLVGHG